MKRAPVVILIAVVAIGLAVATTWLFLTSNGVTEERSTGWGGDAWLILWYIARFLVLLGVASVVVGAVLLGVVLAVVSLIRRNRAEDTFNP